MNNALPINKVICGDAIEQLKTVPNNFFDSIVTDPPAGISFMGKKWDDDKGGRDKWIKWLSDVFIEAKRCLKPGGHALVWALPRTSHWTGFALENAGFEVRDIVHYIFGTGFPKSMDISKQIDKQAGVERKVIGTTFGKGGENLNKLSRIDGNDSINSKGCGAYGRGAKQINIEIPITFPFTAEAKEWDGWGTALKPAVECWWLVRKPISEKTVAENVLKWGTGGLNIDGCRVGTKEDMNPNDFDDSRRTSPKFSGKYNNGDIGQYRNRTGTIPNGRFPANLIHDGSEEVLTEFPDTQASKGKYVRKTGEKQFLGCMGDGRTNIPDGLSDSGSASRFFYCAKPSKAERDAGLQGMKTVSAGNRPESPDPTGKFPDHDHRERGGNNHPTVKAQALMQYLIKLITPPGGIVLDMFAGSGSTLIAAKKLGHSYIGIEIDPDYCKIAEQRLIAELAGNRSLDAYNEYEPKSRTPALMGRACENMSFRDQEA